MSAQKGVLLQTCSGVVRECFRKTAILGTSPEQAPKKTAGEILEKRTFEMQGWRKLKKEPYQGGKGMTPTSAGKDVPPLRGTAKAGNLPQNNDRNV